MTRQLLCFLAVVFTSAALASAQPDDESYNRIARLSYIEGNVSFQRESDVDWSVASINLPLELGDRIYTGPEGVAEVEFDDGSVYRLARNTDVEFLSLKEDRAQIRILLGVSTLTADSSLKFEIDTPAAAFNTAQPGVYRFDVAESGDTEAVVRKGELEAANNTFSLLVDANEVLHVTPAAGSRPEISEYAGRDEWDQWNDRRNSDLNSYAGSAYLPDDVYIGASELNQYGRWIDLGSYGMAWTPDSVDEYWSPYSEGRWCYRPRWGWTWVSYEPWGWLPYHYGRWHYSSRHGWCWLPGPAFAFNFWSPGLVTFYSGPGWISWIPLGPGDYYDLDRYYFNRHLYGHQLAQLRNLHTRAPGDPFNRYARGAFRTAQLDQFRNGSFEGGRSNRWESVDQPWRQGALAGNRLNVQPTAMSYSAQPGRAAVSPRWNTTLPNRTWNHRTEQRPQESGNQTNNTWHLYQVPRTGRSQQTEGGPVHKPENPAPSVQPSQPRDNSEAPRSFGRWGNAGARPSPPEHNQIHPPSQQNIVHPAPAPAQAPSGTQGGSGQPAGHNDQQSTGHHGR